ncbi:MAG: hypothetical protein TREMPRED_003918 [Tremellales sp. Tagirdzhanova-0007]|nr:MAG: hypothetical protein TREMPRED_003918 [Tremellales sp. Tagirdzhanova-0007]
MGKAETLAGLEPLAGFLFSRNAAAHFTPYIIGTVAFILYIFAFNFGTYASGLDYEWPSMYFILVMTIMVPAQMFYIGRAYTLSGNSTLLLSAFSFLLLASVALTVAVKGYAPDVIVDSDALEVTFLKAWLSVGAFLDTMLTASITFFLWRAQTCLSKSDKLSKKLIVLSTEAGLAPAILALAFLGLVAGAPTSSNVMIFIGTPMSFIIALLAVLNGRRQMRDEIEVAAVSGRQTSPASKAGLTFKSEGDDFDLAVDVTEVRFLSSLTIPADRDQSPTF